MELTITNEQKIAVALNPTSESGKSAKIDGIPAWTVQSGGATVIPSADGLSAEIVSSDTDLTDTVIQVDADADLGSGVVTISELITVHTVGAQAKNLGAVAGTPEAK